MFTDSFTRDLTILLLVSILIGSLLASSLSLTANAYFSKALSGLVGDYGEYDLIIQVREEMKDDASIQINKIMKYFQGQNSKKALLLQARQTYLLACLINTKQRKFTKNWEKPLAAFLAEPVLAL